MSWSGRKSEEGRTASSLGHSRTGSNAGGGGGGLFNFLKTELDSFVKGLSGKPDCLQPVDRPSLATPKPPSKKLKSSHEPPQDEESSYAQLKAYERELDAIRQHMTKRYTNQEYYAPLTEANLRASTSKSRDVYLEPVPPINHDRRSQETRTVLDAYSSYYTEESVPRVSHEYSQPDHQPILPSAEKQRKKRERAATFVNDEEARQAVARQLAEEESRLRAAAERAAHSRRRREKDARDAKRRKDRADALARLEAQEVQERAQARVTEQMQAQRQRPVQESSSKTANKSDISSSVERPNSIRQSMAKDSGPDIDTNFETKVTPSTRAVNPVAHLLPSNESQYTLSSVSKGPIVADTRHGVAEEKDVKRVARARDSAHAERVREEAARNDSERKRILELEAEVQKLRRELQETKRKQVEAELSSSASRHVHFAPTPPDSEGHGAEQSFISLSSTTSAEAANTHQSVVPPAPPPPPVAPPLPPVLPKIARISPLALIAARKSGVKSPGPSAKKKPPHPTAGLGMPADMGKFLDEMRTAKLRKVGLPVEGQKKPRDEEEGGLKSILEGVLKKRFIGDKDRSSGSTLHASASTPTLSNTSRLSASTTSSITSFSSYRPPDWSLDISSSSFPPPRSTSLPKEEEPTEHFPHPLPAAEQSSMARAISHTLGTSQFGTNLEPPGLSRSLSQRTGMHRPHTAFGHALTSEAPADSGRQRSQPYAISHGRQTSLSATPAQRQSDFSRHRKDSLGLPEPSTISTERTRTRQSSDNTMTGKSVRSAGSSFDVDIYGQMQLQMNEDLLEEEMRRSFSNPLPVDGAMDIEMRVPSSPAFTSRVNDNKVSQAQSIPSLVFRQPTFTFDSQDMPMPPFRPPMQERKVSSYKNPRPAPAPPSEKEPWSLAAKDYPSADAVGRPLSPSKARAKLKTTRKPLRIVHQPSNADDEVLKGIRLTAEQADDLLREDNSMYTGYGTGRH